jgi:hypothetical protein
MAEAEVLKFIRAARRRITKRMAQRLLLSITHSQERSVLAPQLTISEVINKFEDIINDTPRAVLEERRADQLEKLIREREREEDHEAPSAGVSTTSDIPE